MAKAKRIPVAVQPWLDFGTASISDVTRFNAQGIQAFRETYWAFSEQGTDVRDKMTETFINRLASDAATAKAPLRDVMRRSQYWDEESQMWRLPVKHTVRPNWAKVSQLIAEIWTDNGQFPLSGDAILATKFFLPNGENDMSAVNAIEQITGRPLHIGSKKTKVFHAVSKALQVWNAGAYQGATNDLFTQWTEQQHSFTLYVSINPCHFLSMSNPVETERTSTMTSCHSFNAGQYANGCAGYARDEVALIAFTAKNDEGRLNRKQSRQLFFYNLDGALIQSRLYTSRGRSGGVNDVTGYWEYPAFRQAVQDELARCEGFDSRWQTAPYRQGDNKFGVKLDRHCHFGGYPDWLYFRSPIKVSVRKDKLDEWGWYMGKPFTAGAAGLSVRTGYELRGRRDVLSYGDVLSA